MFSGLLIKESLRDRSVLDRLRIVKEESWDIDDAAEGQSPVWNVAWFEIEEDAIDETVEALSAALELGKWFLEITNDDTMIVVFPGKVFSYKKGDENGRAEAKVFGRSIGIPEHQLDWEED